MKTYLKSSSKNYYVSLIRLLNDLYINLTQVLRSFFVNCLYSHQLINYFKKPIDSRNVLTSLCLIFYNSYFGVLYPKSSTILLLFQLLLNNHLIYEKRIFLECLLLLRRLRQAKILNRENKTNKEGAELDFIWSSSVNRNSVFQQWTLLYRLVNNLKIISNVYLRLVVSIAFVEL